jgi:hypothetical protein
MNTKLCLFIGLASGMLQAQTLDTGILGVVTDPTGASAPRAAVNSQRRNKTAAFSPVL